MSSRLPVGETHRLKARLIRASGKRCQGCGYQFPKRLQEHQLARERGAFELDHKVPLNPNPPKRCALALTPGLMGKGGGTGQARIQ